ncbi:hypothetical protein chiPu_0032974, partial [Chiloscyllium punctatum]|nr:hypothetical protein [Chiloscyllium punctatum]
MCSLTFGKRGAGKRKRSRHIVSSWSLSRIRAGNR